MSYQTKKISLKFFKILILLLSLFPSCSTSPETASSKPTPIYHYQVLNVYPHDPQAFTQGLVFAEGALYEGTGLYQQSSLRRVDLETGKVLQSQNLAGKYFGEGLTFYKNKLIQLTWRAKIGFVYDPISFQQLQTFEYSTEGWGLTHNDRYLIMSDGTATLHFLNPDTLKKIGHLEVFDQEEPVPHLNELEYIEGEVWANVWKTNRIARISLETGKVVGWIDLKGLLNSNEQTAPVDVLNGIAYDRQNKRLFVTGKRWPKLFEIQIRR